MKIDVKIWVTVSDGGLQPLRWDGKCVLGWQGLSAVCAPPNSRRRHSQGGMATVMQGSDSERSSQPPFCLSVEAANGFPQGHALSLILSVLLLSLTPSSGRRGSPEWGFREKLAFPKHKYPVSTTNAGSRNPAGAGPAILMLGPFF